MHFFADILCLGIHFFAEKDSGPQGGAGRWGLLMLRRGRNEQNFSAAWSSASR